MVEFTTALGNVVDIPESEVNVVERKEEYDVLSARHNPSGQTLFTTRYNPGDDEEDSNPLAGEVFDGDGMGGDMNETTINDDLASFRSNPPAKTVDWRNLRLQSVISQEGMLSKASKTKAQLKRIPSLISGMGTRVPVGQSIRGTSLLVLASASDWTEYIRNMTAQDIAAEFVSNPTIAQKAGVTLFTMEWENDPGKTELLRRVRGMSSEEVEDTKAKGQMAYDMVTKPHQILGRKGYGRGDAKMLMLAYDIISSMPLATYNYYTLYQVHPDEGDEIYREFQTRYVPLNTNEVEMVNEISHFLSTEGDGYAFRTTMNETTAIQAAQLMKAANQSYQIGDTITTRTALSTLTSAPFDYKPLSLKQTAGSINATDELGASKHSDVKFIALNVQHKTKADELVDAGHAQRLGDKKIGVWALGVPNSALSVKNKQQIDGNSGVDKVKLTAGATDFTAKYLAIKTGGGKKGKGGSNWNIIDIDEDIVRDGRNTRSGRDKRRMKKALGMGASSNPKRKPRSNPKGRGKILSIEIWPKTQITMKRREKSKDTTAGETRHGNTTMKSPLSKWTLGLHKHFPNLSQMVQIGVLKKTGEEAPYRIRLPITHFKIAHQKGVEHKTIVPKKGSPAMIANYKKLVKRYGWPKHAPSDDTYMRFIISNKDKLSSPYYQEVRKKVGAAKAR